MTEYIPSTIITTTTPTVWVYEVMLLLERHISPNVSATFSAGSHFLHKGYHVRPLEGLDLRRSSNGFFSCTTRALAPKKLGGSSGLARQNREAQNPGSVQLRPRELASVYRLGRVHVCLRGRLQHLAISGYGLVPKLGIEANVFNRGDLSDSGPEVVEAVDNTSPSRVLVC